MKKNIGKTMIIAGSALVVFSSAGALASYTAERTNINNTKTDTVDISLATYGIDSEGVKKPYETVEDVYPGQKISDVAEISNVGSECWLRVKLDFDIQKDSSLVGELGTVDTESSNGIKSDDSKIDSSPAINNSSIVDSEIVDSETDDSMINDFLTSSEITDSNVQSDDNTTENSDLKFDESNLINFDTNVWIKGNDGYYYYKDKLSENKTVSVFDGFSIPASWGNEYADSTVNVNITAEAIQTKNFTQNLKDDKPWGNETVEKTVRSRDFRRAAK